MNLRLAALVAVLLTLSGGTVAAADQYRLQFNRSSSRMSWKPTFPGWSHSFPVTYSAGSATPSNIQISLQAGLGYTLDQRDGKNLWRDSASIRGSIRYPILGPKATIGVNGNMSSSNAALQKQKIRNQSYSFAFQFKPFEDGPFKSMSANLTPGVITAQRASRARVDSTIKETGIQYNASMRVSPSRQVFGQRMSGSVGLTKKDNTLKNNKNKNESLSLSWSYKLPKEISTSLSISESRSERGVTRSVITETETDGEAVRDTTVGADLAQSRNTSLSSSVRFKVGSLDMSQSTSYRQNLSQNTANAARDLRNTYFGRDRKSNSWNSETKISGKLTEKLIGSTRIKYSFKEEGRLAVPGDNGELLRDDSADREDRDLQLVGSLDLKMTEDHSIKVSGQVRRIADDNPGSPEQDQDTFSRSATLSYSGKTAGGTSLRASLTNSFSHRVSLHASRSSNNQRTSDMVLNMSTDYRRLGISLNHNFSVSARRAIFDYDRQVNRSERSRKSNIRRGWKMAHSARRKVFDQLNLNGRYSYSADDFGKLIVESGAQLVEEDNNDHSLSFGMTFVPFKTVSFSLNGRWRLDRQYEHTYVRLLEERNLLRRNEHRNIGGSISYTPTSETSLSMNGSRSKQRSGTFDTYSVTFSRKI